MGKEGKVLEFWKVSVNLLSTYDDVGQIEEVVYKILGFC